MDMHYAADCTPQEHIFHVFDWKNKSRTVRKPLPSHQERCLAPRNRYAASLRPVTVTILQRAYYAYRLYAKQRSHHMIGPIRIYQYVYLYQSQMPARKLWRKQQACFAWIVLFTITVCVSTLTPREICSASLAFVRGIHRWPVNSPHKGPATRKKFPFDVIMHYLHKNAYHQPKFTHRCGGMITV